MDFFIIEDKILELLNTLKWTNKPFNDIYNYYTLENDTYPFVWFELVSENYTQHSSCEDLAEWIFDIYIFQEINEEEWISRLQSRNTIKKWVKEISNIFEKNYTLDWIVSNSKSN